MIIYIILQIRQFFYDGMELLLVSTICGDPPSKMEKRQKKPLS